MMATLYENLRLLDEERRCYRCGAAIEELTSIERGIYALPCKHRLWRGLIEDEL